MVVVHRPRGVCRSSYGLNNQPLAALAIGGTRPGNSVLVPVPPEELPALLTNFEKYLHAENGLPPLVRIGLAHVRLIEQLPMHPVVTIPAVVRLLKTTKPTAGKAVQVLENLGVLVEKSGKQRNRKFAYAAYLEKLRAGTEIESR